MLAMRDREFRAARNPALARCSWKLSGAGVTLVSFSVKLKKEDKVGGKSVWLRLALEFSIVRVY